MNAGSARSQTGMTLLEIMIALTIAGILLAGIMGVLNTAMNIESSVRQRNDSAQQGRFAMQMMLDSVQKTRSLLIPLAENPATLWSESVRNVLAVTLDPTLDRNKDGWADANNDKDYLDVNNNGSRNAGEPERVDEDTKVDNTNDGSPGIKGIDDNGDGIVDNGTANNNDEDSLDFEDAVNGVDDDGDGSVDEDYSADSNSDSAPGITNVDDDFDGAVDEGGLAKINDDDEDGSMDEDWLDAVVYYLNGTTLMQRIPNINPASGADYQANPIAENVTLFQVTRLPQGGGAVLVDINLTITPSGGEAVSFNARVRVGGGL